MKAYPRPRQGRRGVSLVSALLAMGLAAAMMAAAMASWSAVIARQTGMAVSSQLRSHLALARTAALSRAEAVALSPRQGHWRHGWRVHLDPNRNGRWDAGEDVLAEHAVASPLTLTANGVMQHYVLFGPEGRPVQSNGALLAGTFTLCLPQASAVRLVMNATGRVRTETLPAGTCL